METVGDSQNNGSTNYILGSLIVICKAATTFTFHQFMHGLLDTGEGISVALIIIINLPKAWDVIMGVKSKVTKKKRKRMADDEAA